MSVALRGLHNIFVAPILNIWNMLQKWPTKSYRGGMDASTCRLSDSKFDLCQRSDFCQFCRHGLGWHVKTKRFPSRRKRPAWVTRDQKFDQKVGAADWQIFFKSFLVKMVKNLTKIEIHQARLISCACPLPCEYPPEGAEWCLNLYRYSDEKMWMALPATAHYISSDPTLDKNILFHHSWSLLYQRLQNAQTKS